METATFIMSQEDYKDAWKHKCPVKEFHEGGAIGGRMTFSFNPTGLGTIVVASCLCGWTKDYTDYDEW